MNLHILKTLTKSPQSDDHEFYTKCNVFLSFHNLDIYIHYILLSFETLTQINNDNIQLHTCAIMIFVLIPLNISSLIA